MRRLALVATFVFALVASLFAQSYLRIQDVGLHGYSSAPAAVGLSIRNPSTQAQSIRLRVAVSDYSGEISAVTSDVWLNGSEERRLELPVLLNPGEMKIS